MVCNFQFLFKAYCTRYCVDVYDLRVGLLLFGKGNSYEREDEDSVSYSKEPKSLFKKKKTLRTFILEYRGR